jgi:serine/threonine-protein kinase
VVKRRQETFKFFLKTAVTFDFSTMSTADPVVAAPARARRPRLVFGPFAFDPERRLLSRDGQEIPLPPRVLAVLELLLERAGEIVPRQEMIDVVWKDAFVTDTSLAEAVSVLRQALGDDSQSPTYVQTLHRRGYRFVASVLPAAPVARRETSAAAPSEVEERVSPSIGASLIPWSAAVICALIAIAAVWQATRGSQSTSPPAAKFAISPAPGTRFDDAAPAFAFAADGSSVAWSGCDADNCRLYVRPLDSLESMTVAGTEGAHAPFFSPDGRALAFFADGRLKKIAVSGGTPVSLADAPAIFGCVWTGREIVYAGSPTGGLMRVSADGGEPRTLTFPREAEGEVRHAWPSIVPGTSVLLFTIDTMAIDGAHGLMGALSLDAIGRSEASSWRTLADGIELARAPASDTIVMAKETELDAIAFDAARLATSGAPRTVLASTATGRGAAQFALSASGSLIAARSSSPSSSLLWWSSSGLELAGDEVRRWRSASISPDGARLAGITIEGSRSDVWIADAPRGAATRVTHSGVNTSPVWSADGRTIFYAARTKSVFEIWSADVEGRRGAARVFSASRHGLPLAASPDGSLLAFLQTGDRSRGDIWLLPLSGGPPRALVEGPFDDTAAAFSRDSKLVAFQSADNGRWEVHVVRLRDSRRVIVSTDGGERPFWGRDGLFFQSRRELVKTAITDDGNELRVGPLTRVADLGSGALRGVTDDGRALVERPGDPATTAVVSLEWLRDVRTILGPPSSALPR